MTSSGRGAILNKVASSCAVQVFPDKGGNSVIVAGSPAMQTVAANLVRKYDVPQIRTARQLRPGGRREVRQGNRPLGDQGFDQVFDHGPGLDGKGFVQFHQANIPQLQAGPLEGFLRGRDGSHAHDARRDAGGSRG